MDYLFPTILVIWVIVLVFFTRNLLGEKKLYKRKNIELDQKNVKLEKDRNTLENFRKDSLADIETAKRNFTEYQYHKFKEFERLVLELKGLKEQFDKGYIKGREWLAGAYSEYVKTKDNELETSLIMKPNPAWKAAEIVSELRKSRSEMSKRLKLFEYQIKTYEEYFPQLIEYKIAILDELIDFQAETLEDDDIDPSLKFGYLLKEEYISLSNQEKFQLALDRYWKKEKSNLEIGRVYERYIGYLFESQGWIVKYDGIIKGFEDFGRDLICSKGDKVLVIQCKCWSKDKRIREKYVMQLFGTTVLYEYENSIKGVKPLFYSTTALSDEAYIVAERLGVEIHFEDLKRYPMIKCNVNHQTKEKIYHLPFDQQYDNIIIGDQEGECYVETLKEAEALGFRRAFRWKSDN